MCITFSIGNGIFAAVTVVVVVVGAAVACVCIACSISDGIFGKRR